MWRKIIRKELDKSKIKQRQQDVSRSVNQLESTSQKLTKDNLELLEEISKKEEQKIDIIEKTSEFKKLKDKAEKEYIKSNEKLDNLNESIKGLEFNNKDKLDNIKKLEKEYKEKQEKLKKDTDKLEKQLLNKIDDLNNEIILSWLDKNKLIDDVNLLKDNVSSLTKTELNKTKNIKDQEKFIKNIKSNIDKYDDEYISSKIKKDIIKWDILNLEDKKEELSKQFEKIKDDYNELTSNLSKAKKELEKTKETNLILIKREEKLGARETYINRYYEKAGLPIK